MTHERDRTNLAGKPWSMAIFRWAGSKRKLLPLLIRLIPNGSARYIEPFAGSATLFFALHPRKAILGDINGDLMATYAVLKEHPRQLYRIAKSMPTTKSYYYMLRKQSSRGLDAIRRAARFVYLNRYCFNGVYRTNAQGMFNVPRGTKTGNLPPEPCFYRAAVALRAAELRAMDFEACLADVRHGDFIYLDPPYALPNCRTRGEYGPDSFQFSDLRRLFESLERIEKLGGVFLLSFADCEEIGVLKKKWPSISLLVKRHVAGFSHSRLTVSEVLISNRPLPVQ